MTEEKRKAFEQAEKAHKEVENAAMRIVGFILEDEKMRKTTPGHIKDILDKASSIISKVAECITLEQLCVIFEQITKDSSQEQPTCQEFHPSSIDGIGTGMQLSGQDSGNNVRTRR